MYLRNNFNKSIKIVTKLHVLRFYLKFLIHLHTII